MDPEVLIIGGGVIGLSIARELVKKGVSRVMLVEKGVCGSEASWAAAGMLGPQAEADRKDLFFDLCRESLGLYPAFAAGLLEETGIDVELDRTGTLYLAFTDEDVHEIRARFEWQNNSGLPVRHLSADETRKAEPFVSPDIRESLFFPDDWQVDNRRLCAALKKFAGENGVEIREHTTVEELLIEDGRVVGVRTDHGDISAGTVIVAAGAWSSLIKMGKNEESFTVQPVRGEIVAFQSASPLLRHVIYSRRGYVVPRADGRILAGSTSEHVGYNRSITEQAYDLLIGMACEIAPGISDLRISDHWAGLRPHACDDLPVLGPVAGLDELLAATAHYRNGILLAPLTAKIMAGFVTGAMATDRFEAFTPDRFRLKSAGMA